ncbi:hypothetical protein HPB52_023086 [Rhipicephalus sanguineus]|uniref:Retrotransposon gag domain-containing protein n=1 Tax=Rhipicephalus sanguineus TaxID=34632 RepID=A0A9D4Q9S7_RHISA|nr:hypothetical protein HPB52_023086 [Rhipicephalus sanguineus]
MAAHFVNLPPFLNVPGKPSIPWHLWKKIFQVHLKAAGGSGWEDERRASALISVLGIEGQRKYFAAQEHLEAHGGPNATHTASTPTAADSGMVSTDAATTEYDTLLQFLDGLFAESTNVLAERHLFTSRRQLPGETFLDFVTALKEKALSCKFGATYDDRVRDQVIHGVANAHVRAKLLSYGEALTLQKAEEVGRDLEALNKANAAFGENERLLGSHSGYGGSIQCVAAAQNGGSAASLVPHVTQHGGGFPPGAGGRVQDGSAGSTALAQCCVRCQQVYLRGSSTCLAGPRGASTSCQCPPSCVGCLWHYGSRTPASCAGSRTTTSSSAAAVDGRVQDCTSTTRCCLPRPFAMALLSSATLHLLKRSHKFLQPRIVTWGLGRRVLGILPSHQQMRSNPSTTA